MVASELISFVGFVDLFLPLHLRVSRDELETLRGKMMQRKD